MWMDTFRRQGLVVRKWLSVMEVSIIFSVIDVVRFFPPLLQKFLSTNKNT